MQSYSQSYTSSLKIWSWEREVVGYLRRRKLYVVFLITFLTSDTQTHTLQLSVCLLALSLPPWTTSDLPGSQQLIGGGASITMHSCWETCNAVVLNRIWFLLFSCFITSDKSSQSAKGPWMSSVLLLCHAPPFMLFTLNIKTIHLLHRLLLFQRNTKAFTAQRFLGLTRDLLPNGHARFVWEVSWSDARSSEQLLSMEDSNSLFWARAAWLISSPCRSAKLVSAACNHQSQSRGFHPQFVCRCLIFLPFYNRRTLSTSTWKLTETLLVCGWKAA